MPAAVTRRAAQWSGFVPGPTCGRASALDATASPSSRSHVRYDGVGETTVPAGSWWETGHRPQEGDGELRHAGLPEDPLYDFARAVAEAAEALVTTWAGAAQATSPPRLSALQWQALLSVRRSPGINLTCLAEAAGAVVPAASRLCDRLEAAGLLRREQQPPNRREIGLFLTTPGHDAVNALVEQRSRAIHQVLTAVAPGQRAQLLAGLNAFAHAVTDSAERPEEPPAETRDAVLRETR
ncbi:MarR family transcriptional regulator [Streptomyces sp. NPDC006368]|uniref:MarR family transcriptional regulator n=1 Tax=Streptomyces sp. NPDC006368 TaxID=3156760 RepID=UPI0033A6D0A5